MAITVTKTANWASVASGTVKTAAVSWAPGDLVCCFVLSEDGTKAPVAPTVAGLTFTAIGTAVSGSGVCYLHKYQAAIPTATSSGNLSSSFTGSACAWGMLAYRIPAGEHGGVAGVGQASASTAITVSYTKLTNPAYLLFAAADFSAGAATGHVGSPSANSTEDEAVQNSPAYSVYAYRWVLQLVGTATYGIGGIVASGGQYSKGFIEIAPPKLPELVMAPRIAA